MLSRAAVLAVLFAANAAVMAASIRTLPDLEKVTIHEETFGRAATSFAPDATALTTRLANPLSGSNKDFFFFADEYYDVFYSNADGSFNADGAFLTIEAIWTAIPSSGSMNINEVELEFGGTNPHKRFGDFVASFAFGSNCASGGCILGSEAAAVDHNLGTYPRFGATAPSNPEERMRLTIGFTDISPIPEPSTWLLFACGLAGVAALARRARRAAALG